MANAQTSIWSIGELSKAMGVEPYTLRRAMERAVRLGTMPNRRLADHFRFAHSDDFPAIVAVLQSWGYSPREVSGVVIDETGAVFDRMINGPSAPREGKPDA